MITAILSILGSSTVGSIIGGLFAWANKKTEAEFKRIDLEHEKARWEHDLKLRDKDLEYARIESQGKVDVAFKEAEGAIESARFGAISDVQQADVLTADQMKSAGNWRAVLVLADAFRRMIRPVVTVLLVGCALWINTELISRLVLDWPNLTAEQRFDAGMQAFAWVTGQASAVLAYWFVSRGGTGSASR